MELFFVRFFASVRQIRFLYHAAQEHPDELNEATPRRLSSEARERLKRTLRNESK